MRVEATGRKCEIEAKRCHVPFVVSDECPTCGYTVQVDLSSDHYIGYPVINGTEKIFFYHESPEGEEHEWQRFVTIRMQLEVVL